MLPSLKMKSQEVKGSTEDFEEGKVVSQTSSPGGRFVLLVCSGYPILKLKSFSVTPKGKRFFQSTHGPGSKEFEIIISPIITPAPKTMKQTGDRVLENPFQGQEESDSIGLEQVLNEARERLKVISNKLWEKHINPVSTWEMDLKQV